MWIRLDSYLIDQSIMRAFQEKYVLKNEEIFGSAHCHGVRNLLCINPQNGNIYLIVK